ncbi:MAG: hypothetical protein GY883_18335 [Shimia sp.]|nr:hypothetical protein [Shimia sp.]
MTSVASATKRRWFEHQFLGLILFPIFVWAFGVGLHGNPIRPDHHTVLSMMLGGLLGAGLFTATLIANHRQGKISVSVFRGFISEAFWF